MTKAKKRANASRRASKKRVAVALKSFLKKVNPGILKRTVGAKLVKHRGGSITITPIKANPGGEPNLRAGRPSEAEFYRRALNYYNDHGLAESALAQYRKFLKRTKKKR